MRPINRGVKSRGGGVKIHPVNTFKNIPNSMRDLYILMETVKVRGGQLHRRPGRRGAVRWLQSNRYQICIIKDTRNFT